MLIAFKSTAAPEIKMMPGLAEYLLGLVGKHLGARGTIHRDEMATAIARLEAAIAHDKKSHAEHEVHYAQNGGDDEERLGLAQRAYPLLDMMRQAQAAHADVLWGV